jgi:hypothetical protein
VRILSMPTSLPAHFVSSVTGDRLGMDGENGLTFNVDVLQALPCSWCSCEHLRGLFLLPHILLSPYHFG